MIEEATDRGLDTSRVVRAGLPDSWIHQGSRGEQLAEAGLDLEGIMDAIRRAAALATKRDTVPVVETVPPAATY